MMSIIIQTDCTGLYAVPSRYQLKRLHNNNLICPFLPFIDTIYCLDERYAEKNLMRVIQTAAGFCSQHPFTCTVDGFGTFSGRTIFAAVAPSAGWTALRDETFNALSRSCPGTANKDRRPFTPHLTVANRDIPPDAADRAFSHFAQLALSAQFPVTTVALFSRHGGRWEICCEAHS